MGIDNKKYLDTLLVLNQISEKVYKSTYNIDDNIVSLKDFCRRLQECYVRNQSEVSDYELMFNTLQKILNTSVGWAIQKDMIEEFLDISKCYHEYVDDLDLLMIYKLFRRYKRDYIKLCITVEDFKAFRVYDVGNTVTKLNGVKTTWSHRMTKQKMLLPRLKINGTDTNYSCIFIKDGTEERVVCDSIKDDTKVLYRLAKDKYDIALLSYKLKSNKIISLLNIDGLTDKEFIRLVNILDLWQFDRDRGFDSYKYQILCENDRVEMRYIIRELVGIHGLNINSIIDFSYELLLKLRLDDDRAKKEKILFDIVKFKGDCLAYKNVNYVYRMLADEIRELDSLDKTIALLKRVDITDIKGITIVKDGRLDVNVDIEYENISIDKDNFNYLETHGLMVVDKYRNMKIYKNNEWAKEKLESALMIMDFDLR